MNIPFNKPYMTGKELWYIAQAHAAGHLAGDGAFTKQCQAWAEFYSQMEHTQLVVTAVEKYFRHR
jgi:dTDP-4-amino-4,6-dideoxygalactose transaminase